METSDDRLNIHHNGGGEFVLQVKAGQQFDYDVATSFTVTAELAGQSFDFTINVQDIVIQPEITSGASGVALTEETTIASDTIVYQAAGARDTGTISWALRDGDADLFTIDASTGAVTFKSATDIDHEAKPEYAFTIVMRLDGVETVTQAVTVAVKDVHDNAPEFDLSNIVLTASDDLHLYSAPENGSTDPNAARTYFQSSADIENDGTTRVGAEGTGAITIVLLRPDESITITDEISGLSATGYEEDLSVWAVQRNGVWGLEAFSSNGLASTQMIMPSFTRSAKLE